MESGGVGPTGGGSDDIGDISWNVPTVVLRYPSNIPGGPGHNWANGVSMATPIAYKGVIAGAKVQAMTMLDLLMHPELVNRSLGLLPQRANKDGEVSKLHQARRQARHLAQPKDYGTVSAENEELLLRSCQIRHIFGAIRRHLSNAENRALIPKTGQKGDSRLF